MIKYLLPILMILVLMPFTSANYYTEIDHWESATSGTWGNGCWDSWGYINTGYERVFLSRYQLRGGAGAETFSINVRINGVSVMTDSNSINQPEATITYTYNSDDYSSLASAGDNLSVSVCATGYHIPVVTSCDNANGVFTTNVCYAGSLYGGTQLRHTLNNSNGQWLGFQGIIINGTDYLTGNYVSNLNGTLYKNGVFYSENTTTGNNLYFYISESDNYTINISANNYVFTPDNYTFEYFNESVYNYTFINGTSVPFLNISFYDVLTNNPINNVSLVFDGLNNYFTNSTYTGNYFNNSINSDYYRIYASANNYAGNNFYINLTPSTMGIINAYLVNDSDDNNIILTVQDTTLIPIENAVVSVYFKSGTTLKLVGMGRTNVIGKSSFNLNPDYTHTFIIEADGYSTKTFNYLPTESLTITLTDNTAIEYETVLDTINYALSPTNSVITASESQNFTFTVSDSASQLSSFSLQYGNTSEIVTGSPTGGIATLNVNTTLYENSNLLFYYNITTIDGQFYQTSKNYFIMSASAGNTTGFFSFTNLDYSNKALTLLAVLLIAMAMITMARFGFGAGIITLIGCLVLLSLTWLGWVNAWLGYSVGIIVILATLFRGGLFE